ncbi:MAG: hypothetical protein ACRC0V_12665 [Fusobacteriaceae bacterium]
MATQNQISVVIPEETITTVNQKLEEVRKLLSPYLQALTADEKRSLFKMGDKTLATVFKVQDYVQSNPEFTPEYMNTDEFNKDVTTVRQLQTVMNLSNQIYNDVRDTAMLAGSEALQGGLLYYGSVREAHSKGILSAEPIYKDLKERFNKRIKKQTPPEV